MEEHVDPALLNNAVGVAAGPGAEKKVLDVAEPARLLINQIFAFAAAIDATGDLHFACLGGEVAVAVVEGHGDFGQSEAASRGRAVEDYIGHFAAAQTLRALLPQNPAHGVDDIALAAAVGADDPRDPGREIELRLVGEALEAHQFQTLEHAIPS